MKLLFIGGTGTISTAVSELAIKKGMDLFLLNRGKNKEMMPKGANLIQCDYQDKEKLKLVLKDYKFDCIVNWIAFVKEQVKSDFEVFFDMTKQYIFISSASAYQKPLKSYLITESTPLVNPYWDYSRNKIDCEEYLIKKHREIGFPVTIVRPSHTYTNGNIPSSFNSSLYRWSIADRILKGKKIIVHGDGTSLWVLTHNTDFAKGFIGLVGNSKSYGHAFHITSDEVLDWNQIHYMIGSALEVEPNIVHVPSDYLESFMGGNYGLLGDKATSVVFDNSKIKSFVPDFKATTVFQEGIKMSINWFKSNPDLCKLDEKWNSKIDSIVNKFETII